MMMGLSSTGRLTLPTQLIMVRCRLQHTRKLFDVPCSYVVITAGFGTESTWYIGKGGMMKFCHALCRRVTVITDTDILRVERKPGTHLYTLFKRVRAEVKQRGSAATDSSVLAKPVELACGSFEAVICCLPPRPACALMQHVSLAFLLISSCLIAAPRFDGMFDSL
jgi:hypothetical protein